MPEQGSLEKFLWQEKSWVRVFMVSWILSSQRGGIWGRRNLINNGAVTWMYQEQLEIWCNWQKARATDDFRADMYDDMDRITKNVILMHRDGFIGVEGDRKQGQVLDALVLVWKYGEWNRPEAVKIEGKGNEWLWEDKNPFSVSGKYNNLYSYREHKRGKIFREWG